MYDTTVHTARARARSAKSGSGDGGTSARAGWWLGGLVVAYGVLQLAVVVPGTGLVWDETVYTSQVSGSVPAAFFSAPRARGISLLAAPVAELTSSTVALRVWMTVLSCLGLFLALYVWRTLLPLPVLLLAGGFFGTLWITVFYGPQVMPNLYSAYGALAAVGCFLRVARDGTGARSGNATTPSHADRAALVGLCAAVALTGLMRPPDAVWLVGPLAVAALFVPAGRRPLLWAALAAGAAIGCGEWVVEAYVRFGGLGERLHLASAIQGGTGWNIAVDDQVRALDGRSLCRPCDVPWHHRGDAVWFFALPPAVLVGLLAARRAAARSVAARSVVAATSAVATSAVAAKSVAAEARWRNPAPLASLVASSLAVPYLFLLGYAAPRFLLPSYALLAVPVAYGLWAVGRWRVTAGVVLAAVLGVHLFVQFGVLHSDVRRNRASHRAYEAVAARLHQAGVRPPCVLSGYEATPLIFPTGCASRQLDGPDAATTPAGLLASARVRPTAYLVAPGGRPPAFARSWRRVVLPGMTAYVAPGPGVTAYVAPRPDQPTRSA